LQEVPVEAEEQKARDLLSHPASFQLSEQRSKISVVKYRSRVNLCNFVIIFVFWFR